MIELEPMADVRRRFLANERAIGSFFYEREDVVRMTYVATLCREHVFYYGPPGTAKSMLARAIVSPFSGAVHREFLFSRQTTEADVIAHMSVPDFLAGKSVWIMEGHITDSHFAFCDEVFKANGSTLNSMLAWWNERTVKGVHTSPLITAIGASNETPEDESLKALRDRMLVAHVVEKLSRKENKVRFLRDRADGRALPELLPITLDELTAAQGACAAMPLDDAVYDAVLTVQANLQGVGVYVSDRRAGKLLAVLKAYAWLDGAGSVGLEHLDCLRHVLWQDPKEIPAVEAAVGGLSKGIVGEIRAIVEAALRPYHEATVGHRAPDGTWGVHTAKLAYEQRCPDFMEACLAASREIKSRFGGQVPDRVRQRAKEYMDELRSVFDQCKADANIKI